MLAFRCNNLRGMASTRLCLVRFSVVLNAFLVMYLCMTWFSPSPTLSDSRASPHYRSLEGLQEPSFSLTGELQLDSAGRMPLKYESNRALNDDLFREKERSLTDTISDLKKDDVREDIGNPEINDMLLDGKVNNVVNENGLPEIKSKETKTVAESGAESHNGRVISSIQQLDEDSHLQEPPREVQESVGVTEHLVAAPIATDAPDPPLNSLEKKMYPDLRDCPTRPMVPFNSQRGDYWILENYIPAAMAFRCDESITYTTHGDYTFLDNLDTLTSRWQGPVSIAVYAPGADFEATVNTILHLRDCWAEGIKKYVTFHLIYHTNHVPTTIPSTEELMQRKTDCSVDPPKWANVTTYRKQKNLLYPVNIGRNVARRASSTYFVFPSDVELYPSTNFIPEFMKMLKKEDFSKTALPKVFVFSIFEVKEAVSPPETKTDLLAMLKTGEAIPFHKKVCARCHNVPHSKEWLSTPVSPGLSVVHVGKRTGSYKKWEPIYVGTHREPFYDERLSWEGKSDKMTQMYILCVRDYEFLILDNAFLVHRPGIKTVTRDRDREVVVGKQNSLIKKHILPEYKILFGSKKECVV